MCASIITKLGLKVTVVTMTNDQLIKFWPSRAPGKGVCGGAKFLAPPYHSEYAVFVSPPSAFFIEESLQCYTARVPHFGLFLAIHFTARRYA